jgi:4-amino-4-deoxy-L-arabinose transferase-like glycosyltransferase
MTSPERFPERSGPAPVAVATIPPGRVEATGPPTPSRRSRRRRTRRWWIWLDAITLLGFGIRIATVLGRPDRRPGGDAYYYHYAANLLVEGHGFIDPFQYLKNHHHVVQTADWPPLFVLVLAATSVVGLKSFFAHRVWCCIIGAATVTVCGVTGRAVGGRRAGLIAAFLVAVYPNIWMSNELALSETISPLLVALVLLCAYRFWKQPRMRRMVLLGAVMGVAMLGRDELALLVPFIVVPVALVAPMPWRRRVALAGTGTLVALVVIAPWVGYNMSRLERPTLISSGLGITLASANCGVTWSGPFEGYWALECAPHAKIDRHADGSVQSAQGQAYALRYISQHKDRFWRVELARLGRGFGFFHPLQQIGLDSFVETRPYHWAVLGLGMYYGLAALALGGTVVLRRRGVPVFPLWAVGLDVVFTMLVSFGDTRYRTPFEVSLVLLAAVALDAWWGRRGAEPDADDLPRRTAAYGTPRPVPPGTPVSAGAGT